jgi:hypothetical protein
MTPLGTFPSKLSIFRKRVKEVISEVKWSEEKGIRSEEEMDYFQEKWAEMWYVNWSEGNWSEMKDMKYIQGES